MVHDYAEIWEDLDPGSRVRDTFELNQDFGAFQEEGFVLFALRTKAKTSLGIAAGDKQDIEMQIANFHIAYSDSANIVALDPKALKG